MHNRDHLLYKVFCVGLTIVFIAIMLYTVSFMPSFGQPDNPDVNEVMEKYLVDGPRETGALNAVTAMILHYRAFDTLGESCVLFVSSVCVFILLRLDGIASNDTIEAIDRHHEPTDDPILNKTFLFLIPAVFMFGIYVIMNGHLSPGGGFSGGAIIGAGFLLYLNAYGLTNTERFMNRIVYRNVTICALGFYAVAKSYTFYMGANGLLHPETVENPGAILSSGLILPLNICVGIVVSTTIYAFYVMVRKGGFNN